MRILEDGGNAVDAAIGAAVLLGLCEPQSTGLGGDCFVLLKPPGEDRAIALNGSGRSPAGISSHSLRIKGFSEIPMNSAEAITVPGAVDAFCRLSQDWGRAGLALSLAPAIKYADEGVPVAPRVSFDWHNAAETLQGAGRIHYLVDGKAPKPGTIFRSSGQAEVLRRIVKSGRAGFYEGEVAEDMVDTLQTFGGCHTLEDFARTSSTYSEPICGSYANYEILEHPPNGQGAAAILLANILKCLDLPDRDPFGIIRTHLEAEAVKLAYDARDRFIADLDFTKRLDHTLSDLTAEKLAALVDVGQPLSDAANASSSVHRETVLLIVVDRDLMVVSMIYSIFHSFGSGIASEKFAVNFQNRGAGFTLEKGHPNELAGGKRPLHTIIPAMLRQNGRVVMPFGVMGGQYQAAGHARLISNISDYGMHPQEALDGPRSFPEDGFLMLERGYADHVVEGLQKIGHKTAVPDAPIGGGQAIWINLGTGVFEGASDFRKDGCAIGY